jgi:hypothetical protein
MSLNLVAAMPVVFPDCVEYSHSMGVMDQLCAAGVYCRDGLISVTNTKSSRLVACCQDLTGTITPLHMLAVNTSAAPAASAHSDSGAGAAANHMAAAAWLDRVLVFSAPWQASSAAVLSTYQCPEVSRQTAQLL